MDTYILVPYLYVIEGKLSVCLFVIEHYLTVFAVDGDGVAFVHRAGEQGL